VEKNNNMNQKCRIIAEIAGGHMGDLDRCMELADMAIKSGADIIKFQFYKAHELCEKGHSDYELFKSLEFSISEWKRVFNMIRTKGVEIYADIFGADSFQEACSLDVDGYKLHAADLDNRSLIQLVVETSKPILLGIGGHKRIEIYRTVKLIRSISKDTNLILMPGHQLFPTPAAEHNLDELKWFARFYADLDVKVGYADHIDGDDPMALTLPLAAVGAGAVLIEKHLTKDRTLKWEDYESAIEPEDFANLAGNIHDLNNIDMGFPVWTEGRQVYRNKVTKSFFAKKDLAKGSKISVDDLVCLRPGDAIIPLPSDFAIGMELNKDFQESELINGFDLSQNVGILINCRTASQRLPQKALKKICGKETIALLIERMKFCKKGGQIILCTTEKAEDDVLADIAKRENIEVFRGPDENVALRLLLASQKFNLDHIVRVTGDDLLRDIPLIETAIESHLKNHADFTYMKNVVYSCDSEIISVRALETIVERATCPENTEYLTWYLEDETAFVQNCIIAPDEYNRDYRITLDTVDDLRLFEEIYKALYKENQPIDLKSALLYLDEHPEIAKLNMAIKPKLSSKDLDVSLRI
jgi:N,N'-diacetyllegionaminate synthase